MKMLIAAIAIIMALMGGPVMAQQSVKIGFVNTFSGPTAAYVCDQHRKRQFGREGGADCAAPFLIPNSGRDVSYEQTHHSQN
jgi:hypothetical protein